MKKLPYILAILSFCWVSDCYAWDIFGKLFGDIKVENKKMQDSIDKKFSDVNAELGVIKGNQITLQNTITATMNNTANIDSQMKANMQAMVGIGNKMENVDKSVKARDMSNSGNTNDTDLMKTIFMGLSALFLAVIAFMKAQLAELHRRAEYLEKSRAKYQDWFFQAIDDDYDKRHDEKKQVS